MSKPEHPMRWAEDAIPFMASSANNDALAVLNEFSKTDIIEWVRSNFFFKTTCRSELMFIKWQRMSKEIEALENEHSSRRVKGLDVRDGYARQFNASKNNDERLELLNKMKPYDDALMAWIDESKRLDAKREQVDKIYEQYKKTRAGEP